MKKLFTKITAVFILTVILSSCLNSRKSKTTKEENLLIGKWKLIEVKYSIGESNPPWTKATNSYDLTLNKDLSFISTQIIGCANGTYTLVNGRITLLYACGNSTIPTQFTVISNSNSELIIKNVNCIEDCSDKFLKIN